MTLTVTTILYSAFFNFVHRRVYDLRTYSLRYEVIMAGDTSSGVTLARLKQFCDSRLVRPYLVLVAFHSTNKVLECPRIEAY